MVRLHVLHINKSEVAMSMRAGVGDLVSMLKTPDDATRMIERLQHRRETVLSFLVLIVMACAMLGLYAASSRASWWHIPLTIMSGAIIAVAIWSWFKARRIRHIRAIRSELYPKS